MGMPATEWEEPLLRRPRCRLERDALWLMLDRAFFFRPFLRRELEGLPSDDEGALFLRLGVRLRLGRLLLRRLEDVGGDLCEEPLDELVVLCPWCV